MSTATASETDKIGVAAYDASRRRKTRSSLPHPYFLVTCEHGGKRVPPSFRPLFAGHGELLDSHRGYDAGALELAKTMAKALDAPLVSATISRLVIDLNRSLHHPAVFSEISKEAPLVWRDAIIAQHYRPYRQTVSETIGEAIRQGRQIVHVSCHSFTPVLNGDIRNADIGLLFDPKREAESNLCRQWRRELKQALPLHVRLNYPYRGAADGLTTALRKQFPASRYVGIELEINQKWVAPNGQWRKLQAAVINTLRNAACEQAGIGQAAL